jgi:hypothetical protein
MIGMPLRAVSARRNAGGLALSPQWIFWSRTQNARTHAGTPALPHAIKNPRDYAIGLAYLRMLSPEKRSADYLVKETLTSVSLAMRTPWRLRMIGRLVNEQMRRDFAEGAVVTVDRWILSVTEARLYALAALA